MGSAHFKRLRVPWSSASETFAGVLHPSVVTSAPHSAGTAGWIAFNVVEDVQLFVTDAQSNLGWIICASQDETIRGAIYTADYAVPGQRPQLSVVYALEPPLRLKFTSFANLQPQIEVLGTPGQSFVLQSSPDLVSWSSLMTNQLTSVSFLFTDRDANRVNMQFYRTLQPR